MQVNQPKEGGAELNPASNPKPEIRERPILFNGAMVRAILEGRKTVTRRVVIRSSQAETIFPSDFSASEAMVELNSTRFGTTWWKACPYGKPGDRLWVRETFRDARTAGASRILYKASGDVACGWKPSIHMPRDCSRILLEVTDVRVERLQSVTYEQAVGEGIHRHNRVWSATDEGGACHQYPEPAFRDLWLSTGGDWDANPWVWVVEFKRMEVPHA